MSVKKCEIVQQIKFLPAYPDWKAELEKNLNTEPNIDSWAYILHDRDIHEDGTPKEPHVHIVIALKESRQFSTIGNYVGVAAQYVTHIRQRIKVGKSWRVDIGGALSYLTHRNAKDRYQYDDSEVIAKPGYDWIAIRTKSEMDKAQYQSFQKLLDSISTGNIRRFNLFSAITMQQYIDHKLEIEKAFEFREGRLKMDSNRKIEVIFITGQAGSGKTTLAKQFCDERELSYCISGSSRDPLQDYNGQDVLVLDDLRPSVFPLADLLKLLDNNSASSASARYRDKWLEVRYIIITTVLSIEKFFWGIQDKDEPIHQLKRRCKTMIRLTADYMELYSYRSSTQEYMQIACGANPVAKLYQAQDVDTSEEDLKALCSSFGLEYSPEGLPSDYQMENIIPFI